MVKPAGRKRVAVYLMQQHKLSERRACRLAQVSRTAFRHQPKRPLKDKALRDKLKAYATQYSRYGYLMLHELLKKEGLVVNRKRTYRIYTEEALQVRTKKRKKLIRPRLPMEVPSEVNQRWSMDFVADQLANGRRFRVLNVVDDFSRELIGQLVSVSINGNMVARFLDQLMEIRKRPKSIVCDNGTEFTSKAMFNWSRDSKVKLAFIQPGKPTQNAFVESLNGKFRNECLNQHWFRTLAEAKYEIGKWREHYKHVRPHSSLNYLAPKEFVEQAA